MQNIVHLDQYDYLHPIFVEFENLYRELSNNDQSRALIPITFDTGLKVFEEIFNEYGNCEKYLLYSDKCYTRLDVRYNRKNVIVSFSGGKDSTATAIYYKNKCFNVYLYHVHGLNKFFPQELESAKAVADELGLPLIVENVKLTGTSLYPDHPLKNIIIANMALQWGIRNNVGVRLAFGNYYTSFLEDNDFDTAGDDCVEMWQAYRNIMKQYIPHIKVELPLKNITSTLTVFEDNIKLLGLTQSCVMTYRFKNKHRERIQNEYGLELLPNRCGCCWKDCVEYIWFADKGLLPLNKPYYVHCLEVLANTHEKETGMRYFSVRTLWGDYFFYPLTESIMHEEIQDAIIQSHGKVVCSNHNIEG